MIENYLLLKNVIGRSRGYWMEGFTCNIIENVAVLLLL